jgi:hypothetical protein
VLTDKKRAKGQPQTHGGIKDWDSGNFDLRRTPKRCNIPFDTWFGKVTLCMETTIASVQRILESWTFSEIFSSKLLISVQIAGRAGDDDVHSGGPWDWTTQSHAGTPSPHCTAWRAVRSLNAFLADRRALRVKSLV